jgi:para-aminobenzoate synthetase component 1
LLAALPARVGAAVVRRDDALLVGVAPTTVVTGDGAQGLDALDRLDHTERGFWVGACAFELGHSLEPVPPRSASLEPAAAPDVVMARFDALAEIAPDGRIVVRGTGEGFPLLTAAAEAVDPSGVAPIMALDRAAAWRSSLTRDEYEECVAEVLELLRAGECYQVNLTRRLERDGALDPVALHAALGARHPAPYAGMLRLPAGMAPGLDHAFAVVSASPEGFLRRRGDRVESRPIKGTAAGHPGDAARLRASAKDQAENVMIVDLTRNDLGRVCVPGTITVPELCAVEAHPGLHHLVSTVRGRLRADVGVGALLAATFPPASVTGAPKPRVLRAIEELEPVRRGVYCGAFGWIDTRADDADLAVAIRTFTVHGNGDDGVTRLGVGGGVVADSDPRGEWDETCLKARRLLAAADAGAPALVRA